MNTTIQFLVPQIFIKITTDNDSKEASEYIDTLLLLLLLLLLTIVGLHSLIYTIF